MPALLKYQHSLKSLGIQTWTVSRPNVFLGEVAITLDKSLQIILLSDEGIDKRTPFINDILTALQLTHANIELFQFSKIPHLISPLKKSEFKRLVIFFQGSCAGDLDPEKLAQEQILKKQIEELKRIENCYLIEIEPLNILYSSVTVKRKLWKELTNYVSHKTF